MSSGLFQCFMCLECLPFGGVTEDIRIVPSADLGMSTLRGLSAASVAKEDLDTSELPKDLAEDVRVRVHDASLIPTHFFIWNHSQKKKYVHNFQVLRSSVRKSSTPGPSSSKKKKKGKKAKEEEKPERTSEYGEMFVKEWEKGSKKEIPCNLSEFMDFLLPKMGLEYNDNMGEILDELHGKISF